jgi:hypothetical protein
VTTNCRILLLVSPALLIVDNLRRGFTQFKLVAHFLEAGNESVNLLLLLPELKIDPAWDNVRSDSRFIAVLKKIGLEK